MRQFARSHQLTTSNDFLPGTNARTNVVIDRLIIETYDTAGTDTVTLVDGQGTTLFQATISTGRDTPFEMELSISSGHGVRAYVGSANTQARIVYFISSQRPEMVGGQN